MKSPETMSISEFLHGKKEERFSVKAQNHFNKYALAYKTAGTAIIILTTGMNLDSVLAADGVIDREAHKLYYELAGVGKWIIAFKGALEVIKSVGNGDFENAKKATISHIIIFIMLLGIPFGMEKVDELFERVTKA